MVKDVIKKSMDFERNKEMKKQVWFLLQNHLH